MKFFKSRNYLTSDIYVLPRETAKTLFFKTLKPNKEFSCSDGGILFMSMGDLYTYELFDLNQPIINNEEIKMLKTKCNFQPITTEEKETINNSFFINKSNIQNVENNNHMFLNDNYVSIIPKAFEVKRFVFSLTSNYLLNQLKREQESNGGNHNYYTTKIYNEVLQKFKTFYNGFINCKKHIISRN
jgi:hypothetical protein